MYELGGYKDDDSVGIVWGRSSPDLQFLPVKAGDSESITLDRCDRRESGFEESVNCVNNPTGTVVMFSPYVLRCLGSRAPSGG